MSGNLTQPRRRSKHGRGVFFSLGALLLVGLLIAMVKIDLWRVHFGYAQAAERY